MFGKSAALCQLIKKMTSSAAPKMETCENADVIQITIAARHLSNVQMAVVTFLAAYQSSVLE